MAAEVSAASRAGILGMVLAGLCSLLSGLVIRVFSLEPIVYFAAVAGVLFPMVMIATGMIAWWISLASDRSVADHVRSSLVAGILAALGGLSIFVIVLVMPVSGMLPLEKLLIYVENLGISGYVELVVLLLAYLALSVIGGFLYDLVVPKESAIHY